MKDSNKESKSIQQLIERINDSKESIRREAVREIGLLEELDVAQSVPILIRKFEDVNNVRREAVQALVKIGRKNNGSILPKLIDYLDDNSTLIRWGAAFTIGSLGKYAKGDVDSIISHIESEEESSVRKKLVWALGKIGVRNDTVLDTLTRASQDQKSEVRYKAAQALGRIAGEKAIDILLTILLNDETVIVRAAAAEAFKKVRNEAKDRKDFLINALIREKDLLKRKDIAFALFYLEDKYGIGLKELERQLKTNNLPKWQKNKIEVLLQKKKK